MNDALSRVPRTFVRAEVRVRESRLATTCGPSGAGAGGTHWLATPPRVYGNAREADILALAAMRIHAKEGAARVGCHPSSVYTYWRRIIRKTGNGSRCEVLAALLSFSLDASVRTFAAM